MRAGLIGCEMVGDLPLNIIYAKVVFKFFNVWYNKKNKCDVAMVVGLVLLRIC